MRRWVVGFELHHKLLLSVHQPAFTAGFRRMAINEGAVLVGHAAESGEHPDQTGSAGIDPSLELSAFTIATLFWREDRPNPSKTMATRIRMTAAAARACRSPGVIISTWPDVWP